MDARYTRAALIAAILFVLPFGLLQRLEAASFRTQHFVVTAPTQQIAQAVAQQAEVFRRDLAIEWLGRELPQWSQPCPITVQVGPNLGAGGATSFMFDRGRPFGWKMSIQGSYERVMDSVLPHEVTHTIFATHFGQPLPRWADEGACTTVEHVSEKTKQHHNLIRFLQTNRGIPFNRMFAMKEYPPDVLPLYAQGYSVTRWLIMQGGKPHFVNFVADGLKTNNWPAAVEKFYGYRDLSDLQVKWNSWVAQGSPAIQPENPTAIASTGNGGGGVYRGQSPESYDQSELQAVPPQALASNGSSKDGLRWRARNRRARDMQIPAAVEQSQVPVPQSTARQQSAQQPKTTILEWSAEPAASINAEAVQPASTGGRSIYDRTGFLGGRIRR